MAGQGDVVEQLPEELEDVRVAAIVGGQSATVLGGVGDKFRPAVQVVKTLQQ